MRKRIQPFSQRVLTRILEAKHHERHPWLQDDYAIAYQSYSPAKAFEEGYTRIPD